MNVPILITPPVAEPITLAQAKLQIGYGPMEDSDHVKSQMLSDQLRPMIVAARMEAESYLRRALLTQTWLYLRDRFAGFDPNYNYNGYAAIWIPQPPFQSLAFFKYVDVSGVVQTLTIDTTYGTAPNEVYGYQLVVGSDTMPATVMPPFARPWPPTRMVPSNVMLQFKCGYGGPVMASMTAGSAILSGPVFNPGDVGQAVSVPSAGASGAPLITTIFSVDVNGQATLAANATGTVTNVTVWAGNQVPAPILQAIKLLVEYYYGSSRETALLNAAQNQMKPYRNFIC